MMRNCFVAKTFLSRSHWTHDTTSAPLRETFPLQYPRQKLPEERKRRIRHYHIRFIPQPTHLLAPEVAVALHVIPLQVIEVDSPVGVRVMVEDEYLAANRRLLRVEVRVLLLEERRLVPQWFSATKITKVTKTTFPFVFLCVLCGYKNLFACGGVAGGDELLQAEAFEVLGEEAGELAPSIQP